MGLKPVLFRPLGRFREDGREENAISWERTGNGLLNEAKYLIMMRGMMVL